MKVTELIKEITLREGKRKNLTIADVSEVVKITKDIILEKSGLDLYRDIIRNIK